MQISSETLPNCLKNDMWLGQTQKDGVGSGFVLIQNRQQWAVCSCLIEQLQMARNMKGDKQEKEV